MPYHPSVLFAKVCICLDETPAQSLADLARQFEVDAGTIESVVTAMTGGSKFCSFKDDILIARLTRMFLAKPEAPIKELSFELGYKSPVTFARAVRDACGVSPPILRKRIVADIAAQRAVGTVKAATMAH